MTCTIHVSNDVVKVALFGNIDVDTATSMRERLFPLIEKGFKCFMFDFEEVDSIDSACIGILVVIQKKVAHMNGRVILHGLQGHVKEIFQVTRVGRNFEIQS